MKIAFIGGGNMASALIGGLVNNSTHATDILVIDPNDAARAFISARYPGISTLPGADPTLAEYDAIVLAVKPQAAAVVCRQVAPHVVAAQVVVSIVAGIRITDISRWLKGHVCIVRCMPNTPALVGKGVCGLMAMPSVDDARRTLANHLMESVGRTVWVEHEDQIDAVTAISGSGPAYVFYFIEALQEAARYLGLDDEQGCSLAIATFEGAALLAVQSTNAPSLLRENVTSKGGTTAAALASFDQQGIKDAIIKGVIAAKDRATAMADGFAKAD